MRMVRFGRTNVMVPAVSLGTWGHGGPNKSGEISVGWAGHDDGEASRALVEAWRRGITHWDSADVYGNGRSEKLIGALWDEVPRREIFLATKVGWDKGEFAHYYHPRQMRKKLDESLRNLRVEEIDLYYLHHCDFGEHDEYFDDANESIHRFREEGKIRFIGLSDWDSSKIMKFIARVDPDVVQPYRNVVDDHHDSSGLKKYVAEHDLGVAFFSPIKHGLLLGKYDAPAEFPDGDFRSRIEGFKDAKFIERMKRAKRSLEERFRGIEEPVMHGVIGALLTGNPTATVLLGQRNPRQVAAAAVIGETLSKEDLDFVLQLYRG
jgi:aryl-alcohol dehydrogenase-like predicted oxidoreductase